MTSSPPRHRTTGAQRRSRALATAFAAVAATIGLVAAVVPAAGPPGAGGGRGAAARAPGGTVLAATTTPADLGHDRIGVRRVDTWFLRNALDGGPSARRYREGPARWTPLAGDFDGNGDDGLALYSAGTFALRDTQRGPARVVRYGRAGDVPVVGDFDGDGVDTVGVFRRGQWHLRRTNSAGRSPDRTFAFGRAGDVPVVGDWDGDGVDDIAVRRGGLWFQRDTAGPGPSSRRFSYGLPTDLPLAGDWDHDGRDSPGVFRAGTWFLRQGATGPSQVVRYGAAGDRPVVRRTRELAAGVRHTVVRDAAVPWVAHVASIALAAASSPDPVLSQGLLLGTEPLTTMVRRAGAVLGVNGDFALANGRPVHFYAEDGRLLQSDLVAGGRALALDVTGTRPALGTPRLTVRVTARPGLPGARSAAVLRVNTGAASAGGVAAYSAAGAGLAPPADGQCYAVLVPAGAPRPDRAGTVSEPARAQAARCGGRRPARPPSATLLAAPPTGPGADFLRALRAGTPVTTTALLGFPGAYDVLGGGPALVAGGAVVTSAVDLPGDFYRAHPRTAVGLTADGRLLLVVVDGRQPGYSRGMTLRQLAELMRRLGARSALNLDGGGSAEMVVNGVVASRPSDRRERPVANALVVLPGPDRAARAPAPAAARLQAAVPPADRLGTPGDVDGASTGGLADALQRAGAPLPADLRRSALLFRATSSVDDAGPQR